MSGYSRSSKGPLRSPVSDPFLGYDDKLAEPTSPSGFLSFSKSTPGNTPLKENTPKSVKKTYSEGTLPPLVQSSPFPDSKGNSFVSRGLSNGIKSPSHSLNIRTNLYDTRNANSLHSPTRVNSRGGVYTPTTPMGLLSPISDVDRATLSRGTVDATSPMNPSLTPRHFGNLYSNTVMPLDTSKLSIVPSYEADEAKDYPPEWQYSFSDVLSPLSPSSLTPIRISSANQQNASTSTARSTPLAKTKSQLKLQPPYGATDTLVLESPSAVEKAKQYNIMVDRREAIAAVKRQDELVAQELHCIADSLINAVDFSTSSKLEQFLGILPDETNVPPPKGSKSKSPISSTANKVGKALTPVRTRAAGGGKSPRSPSSFNMGSFRPALEKAALAEMPSLELTKIGNDLKSPAKSSTSSASETSSVAKSPLFPILSEEDNNPSGKKQSLVQLIETFKAETTPPPCSKTVQYIMEGVTTENDAILPVTAAAMGLSPILQAMFSIFMAQEYEAVKTKVHLSALKVIDKEKQSKDAANLLLLADENRKLDFDVLPSLPNPLATLRKSDINLAIEFEKYLVEDIEAKLLELRQETTSRRVEIRKRRNEIMLPEPEIELVAPGKTQRSRLGLRSSPQDDVFTYGRVKNPASPESPPNIVILDGVPNPPIEPMAPEGNSPDDNDGSVDHFFDNEENKAITRKPSSFGLSLGLARLPAQADTQLTPVAQSPRLLSRSISSPKNDKQENMSSVEASLTAFVASMKDSPEEIARAKLEALDKEEKSLPVTVQDFFNRVIEAYDIAEAIDIFLSRRIANLSAEMRIRAFLLGRTAGEDAISQYAREIVQQRSTGAADVLKVRIEDVPFRVVGETQEETERKMKKFGLDLAGEEKLSPLANLKRMGSSIFKSFRDLNSGSGSNSSLLRSPRDSRAGQSALPPTGRTVTSDKSSSLPSPGLGLKSFPLHANESLSSLQEEEEEEVWEVTVEAPTSYPVLDMQALESSEKNIGRFPAPPLVRGLTTPRLTSENERVTRGLGSKGSNEELDNGLEQSSMTQSVTFNNSVTYVPVPELPMTDSESDTDDEMTKLPSYMSQEEKKRVIAARRAEERAQEAERAEKSKKSSENREEQETGKDDKVFSEMENAFSDLSQDRRKRIREGLNNPKRSFTDSRSVLVRSSSVRFYDPQAAQRSRSSLESVEGLTSESIHNTIQSVSAQIAMNLRSNDTSKPGSQQITPNSYYSVASTAGEKPSSEDNSQLGTPTSESAAFTPMSSGPNMSPMSPRLQGTAVVSDIFKPPSLIRTLSTRGLLITEEMSTLNLDDATSASSPYNGKSAAAAESPRNSFVANFTQNPAPVQSPGGTILTRALSSPNPGKDSAGNALRSPRAPVPLPLVRQGSTAKLEGILNLRGSNTLIQRQPTLSKFHESNVDGSTQESAATASADPTSSSGTVETSNSTNRPQSIAGDANHSKSTSESHTVGRIESVHQTGSNSASVAISTNVKNLSGEENKTAAEDSKQSGMDHPKSNLNAKMSRKELIKRTLSTMHEHKGQLGKGLYASGGNALSFFRHIRDLESGKIHDDDDKSEKAVEEDPAAKLGMTRMEYQVLLQYPQPKINPIRFTIPKEIAPPAISPALSVIYEIVSDAVLSILSDRMAFSPKNRLPGLPPVPPRLGLRAASILTILQHQAQVARENIVFAARKVKEKEMALQTVRTSRIGRRASFLLSVGDNIQNAHGAARSRMESVLAEISEADVSLTMAIQAAYSVDTYTTLPVSTFTTPLPLALTSTVSSVLFTLGLDPRSAALYQLALALRSRSRQIHCALATNEDIPALSLAPMAAATLGVPQASQSKGPEAYDLASKEYKKLRTRDKEMSMEQVQRQLEEAKASGYDRFLKTLAQTRAASHRKPLAVTREDAKAAEEEELKRNQQEMQERKEREDMAKQLGYDLDNLSELAAARLELAILRAAENRASAALKKKKEQEQKLRARVHKPLPDREEMRKDAMALVLKMLAKQAEQNE